MAPRSSKTHKHIKTNHTAVTDDGWRLHIVRTQNSSRKALGRTYPVVLVPGLCSSGAYTFDLSPVVSLADWLAERDWDVWTIELRGNGRSDKPSLLTHRSHWWTIDDMVDKDLPAALAYITMITGCTAAHCIGHSMGGMILTAALAKGDAISQRMRSVTLVGSTCFLKGSWWAVARPTFKATKLLYSVPAGATLRLYSNFAFTRLGVRVIDVLYFWPSNTDPALARAVLARNFSSTSPGVISQFGSAFSEQGLRSSHPGRKPYADPATLAKVHTPVFILCGDKDKMCPPQGAAKQYQLLGSSDKKLVIMGPRNGHSTHYGHFDILMGKAVHTEVFPQLHAWLESHDFCQLESTTTISSSSPATTSISSNSISHVTTNSSHYTGSSPRQLSSSLKPSGQHSPAAVANTAGQKPILVAAAACAPLPDSQQNQLAEHHHMPGCQQPSRPASSGQQRWLYEQGCQQGRAAAEACQGSPDHGELEAWQEDLADIEQAEQVLLGCLAGLLADRDPDPDLASCDQGPHHRSITEGQSLGQQLLTQPQSREGGRQMVLQGVQQHSDQQPAAALLARLLQAGVLQPVQLPSRM